MENDNPSLWDRAAMGARWMRDSFASWFTTSWLYLILWGVVGVAFTVLLYIDGVFSRSLAPDSIEPLSFQAMGWAYRFFAAGFLMAAARCAFKNIPGKWTFRLLGIFASAIVCLHAFGFGFEALSDKRDGAEITRQTQDNLEASSDARIAQYNKQIDGIRADRDKAIETAQEGIDSIKDEVPGLSADDNRSIREFQAAKEAATTEASAKIAEVEAKIEALLTPESDEAAAEQAEQKAESEYVEKWHPLFVGLAQLFNASWTPTDNEVYIAAIVFIIFWVLLAESLVIFLPERIYVMHMHDAEFARRSEAQKRRRERERAEAEQEEEARIPIEDKGYWQGRILKALNTRLRNPNAQGLKDTYFDGVATVAELENWLKFHLRKGLVLDAETGQKLTQDNVDFILRQGKYAPPVPAVNGHDHSTKDADDADDKQSGSVSQGA